MHKGHTLHLLLLSILQSTLVDMCPSIFCYQLKRLCTLIRGTMPLIESKLGPIFYLWVTS